MLGRCREHEDSHPTAFDPSLLPPASPLADIAAAAQSFSLCLNDVTDQMLLIVRIELYKLCSNIVIDPVLGLDRSNHPCRRVNRGEGDRKSTRLNSSH